ncbi:nucleosome assembly protein 1;2-like [Silene latifolia]|uniref:nucleosome assembly protein 1;2-like n=1 Tax=Silene latifolia TaxID=37657 RepID=UPI003D78761E
MENSDYMEKLQLKHSLEDLKQIQCKVDGLELKHFEERKTLEKEYRKKFQPLYEKRYEIVNGDSKVVKGKDKPGQDIGVPNFWLTAMKSNEVVALMIQKHDEDALKYLKDIKWRRIELSKDEYPQAKATGFKIEFFFDHNPYFRNPVLSKTYCMVDEDNDLLARAFGTEIKWFPRKCLTNIVLRKCKSSVGMITLARDSFFNFFKRFEILDVDVDDIDEMVESLIYLMKQDYNVGVNLKEDIIPHAVHLFTEENFDDISNSHKNAKSMKLFAVQQNVKLLKEI